MRILGLGLWLVVGSLAHAQEPTAEIGAAEVTEDDLPEHIIEARERGFTAYHDGRHLEVAPHLRPVLPELVARVGHDHPLTLDVREKLAYIQFIEGDAEGALAEIERCIQARIAAHGRASVHTADAVVMLASVLSHLQRWEASTQACLEAMRMLSEAGVEEHHALDVVEWTLGVALGEMGDVERAVEVMQVKVARAQRLHGADSSEALIAVGELATIVRDYDSAARARTLLEPAVATSVDVLGPKHIVSRQLRLDLARTMFDDERFTEAITLLREVVPGMDPDAHTLNMVVDAYMVLGDALSIVGEPEWREWIDRAIVLVKARRGPDAVKLALLYDLLAERLTMRVVTQWDLVAPLAEESLRIRRKVLGPTHPKTVESELKLAGLEVDVGKLDRARVRLAELSAREGVGDDTLKVMLQSRLADLYFQEGRLEECVEVRRSIARLAAMLPPEVVGFFDVVNQLHIAWALLRLGRTDEARVVIEESMEALNRALLERLMRNGDDVVMHLLQQWDVAAHLMLSIRQEPAYDEANWGELLVWRGFGPRLLAYRSERVSAQPDLRTIRDERAALRREIADRVGRIARQQDAPANELTALNEARREVDRLEHALLEQLGPSPEPDALAPDIGALCAALPRKSRLIDLFRWTRLGEAKAGLGSYDAFILSSEDCSVVRVGLGSRKAIDRQVDRWRSAITAEGASPELAQRFGVQVSEVLLAPMLPHLQGAEHLVVVPDAGLALVAWAGLPHPDGGYLIEHADLSVLRDSAELLRAAPKPNGSPRTLLVGDVDYGDLDDAVAAVDPTDGEAPLDRSACLGGRFRELPGTVSELDAVGRAVTGAVERLQGAAATPDAVRVAMQGSSRIHLATHGFFLDERCVEPGQGGVDAALTGVPLARSGLALSGANQGSATDGDGLLTAQDLLDVDLRHTELVVLSACDTGRGALTRGQGVLGLQWALSLAGVRNQVFSLWPVPDQETSALMADFYDALGRGRPCRRCGAAAALQHAQRQALARQRAAGQVDIRTWAAFQASGPPEPMR